MVSMTYDIVDMVQTNGNLLFDVDQGGESTRIEMKDASVNKNGVSGKCKYSRNIAQMCDKYKEEIDIVKFI